MAMGNKSFIKATGVKVLAHVITQKKSNSVMRARSSHHGSLDGLNDILSIIDELHAVDTRLYNVVVSGLKKRRDSLLLCITTAGDNLEGVGFAQSNYSKRVAIGEIKDEQTFSLVYTLDDYDDIFNESNWVKANPNYGISVDPIAMKSTAEKGREIPTELANFKTKNLNIWTSEMNQFFSPQRLRDCADKVVREEEFFGQPCRVAVDLANRIDLTCYVKIFKRDGIYYIFEKSYLPRETLKTSGNNIYLLAERNKELIVTEGDAVDQDKIRDDLLADSKNFKMVEVFFDIWNASNLMNQLKNERVNTVEMRMSVANLSEPMKTLDQLIRQRKVVHKGSELFIWSLSNVIAKIDANDNVYPRKASDSLKIDLAVATIMSLAGWIQEDKKKNAYEHRGLRFL
jgi:phage terminase large subunit-like protein